MKDFFDRASELEDRQREEAIARERSRTPRGPSASHCKECGEPIPQARRRALPGVDTCVECQALIETEKKKNGRA